MFFYFYIISQFFHFSTKKQAQRDTGSVQFASISLCPLLSEGLGDLKPADEADADLFFGEDGHSFNHPIYQGVGILRKVEIFCGDEFHDFLGFVFSAIFCWASSSARFFICLSWSISSLICLIRRSTISLPSIVSSRSNHCPGHGVCFLSQGD